MDCGKLKWIVSTILISLSGFIIGQDIKVMSYNIRLDAAGDKEDNWHQRKMDVVEFIQSESPDFLGLQESMWHQTQYLDSFLLDYKFIGVGRDDGYQEGEMMAIFYHTSWKLEQEETIWLSATPAIPSRGWDAVCHRTGTYGVFGKDGVEIALFNTHFDHVGKEARQNSAKLIQAHLIDKKSTKPLIVMGDLNVIPEDPVIKTISDFVFDSHHSAPNKNEMHPGSFNGFKTKGPFLRRIDYVFHNERIKPTFYNMPAPKTQEGRQLSDHFPIIVNMTIL